MTSSPHIPQKKISPMIFDIRGRQSNWNWRLSEVGPHSQIVYQTRFSSENHATIHRNADPTAPLLASIDKDPDDYFNAAVTFPKQSDELCLRLIGTVDPQDEDIPYLRIRWSFSLPLLASTTSTSLKSKNKRELSFDWTDHPEAGQDLHLRDAVTKEVLGQCNDNYMALHVSFPAEDENMVEQLVFVGTAVQMLCAGFMHSDMSIAARGPKAEKDWKWQTWDPDGEAAWEEAKRENERTEGS